uniref:Uncharacterized protein n=1 Tax=Palpitomonas bilix TaxID=652834 RepID=A0A7S3DGV2_9EUKA|mmetsp:Transcript_36974/g.95860  ORF Transcript_36974/g.95860 Transcript_36974/m.95860 type:complete len:407 (+) Transcript_36974:157-1377(+)
MSALTFPSSSERYALPGPWYSTTRYSDLKRREEGRVGAKRSLEERENLGLPPVSLLVDQSLPSLLGSFAVSSGGRWAVMILNPKMIAVFEQGKLLHLGRIPVRERRMKVVSVTPLVEREDGKDEDSGKFLFCFDSPLPLLYLLEVKYNDEGRGLSMSASRMFTPFEGSISSVRSIASETNQALLGFMDGSMALLDLEQAGADGEGDGNVQLWQPYSSPVSDICPLSHPSTAVSCSLDSSVTLHDFRVRARDAGTFNCDSDAISVVSAFETRISVGCERSVMLWDVRFMSRSIASFSERRIDPHVFVDESFDSIQQRDGLSWQGGGDSESVCYRTAFVSHNKHLFVGGVRSSSVHLLDSSTLRPLRSRFLDSAKTGLRYVKKSGEEKIWYVSRKSEARTLWEQQILM